MTKVSVALGVSAIFLTGLLAGLLLARSDLGYGLTGNNSATKIDEVLTLIRRVYLDPPEDDKLVESAIRGMTELLDPYSIYIDERQLPSIREDISGNFGGVGLWFEMVSDTARVVSVVAGGPSDDVGVLPGDRILAIDDSSAIGLPSLVVQNKIKGRTGTPVELVLYRPTIGKDIPVTIVRGIIPINSVVAAFMLDNSTAYVRLARFSAETATEFRTDFERLLKANASRLLLDLRDNPGGLLEAAVQLADELLPAGATIVRTEGKNGKAIDEFQSTSGGLAETIPLIILVNENSASASEIVAGAVQDNDRGLVVGRPTFGKGLVQSQFLFGDGSGLHLTVARYHTPVGRPIQNNLTRSEVGHMVTPRNPTVDPDSLKSFTTVHGRTIKGGQGIYPDKLFDYNSDQRDGYFRFVFQSGYDLAFVRRWFDGREARLRSRWADRQDEFLNAFTMGQDEWAAFDGYVRAEGAELPERFTAREAQESRSRILILLKGRLGQLLYGPSVWQPIVSRIDPEITFAASLWNEANPIASE